MPTCSSTVRPAFAAPVGTSSLLSTAPTFRPGLSIVSGGGTFSSAPRFCPCALPSSPVGTYSLTLPPGSYVGRSSGRTFSSTCPTAGLPAGRVPICAARWGGGDDDHCPQRAADASPSTPVVPSRRPYAQRHCRAGRRWAPRCGRAIGSDAFWERSWRYSWVCAGAQVFIASRIAWGTGVPNTILINRFLQQIHS